MTVYDTSKTAPEIQRRLDAISQAAIELYRCDLSQGELEVALAALGRNEMFQQVFHHAQRAALRFELAQTESRLRQMGAM